MDQNKKKITLTLELTQDDFMDFAKKAARVSISPESLLENMIADLICGQDTNGSDERMHMENWFNRCRPNWTTENNFLTHLMRFDILEHLLDNYNEVLECDDMIRMEKEKFKSGVLCYRDGKAFYWSDIKDENGEQAYISIDAWQETEREDYLGELEELTYRRECAHAECMDIWNEYLQYNPSEKDTYEDSIKSVIMWKDRIGAILCANE